MSALEFLKKEVSIVAERSEPDLSTIIDFIQPLSLAVTVQEADKVIESLETKTGIDSETLRKLAAWISTFTRYVSARGEQEADLHLGPEFARFSNGSSSFRKLLDASIAIKAIVGKTSKTQTTVRGVVPCLESFAATVELRGVLDNGVADHSRSLEGEYEALAPIASVTIGLDGGLTREVSFQIGEAELKDLLHALENIARRMKQLQDFSQRLAGDE